MGTGISSIIFFFLFRLRQKYGMQLYNFYIQYRRKNNLNSWKDNIDCHAVIWYAFQIYFLIRHKITLGTFLIGNCDYVCTFCLFSLNCIDNQIIFLSWLYKISKSSIWISEFSNDHYILLVRKNIGSSKDITMEVCIIEVLLRALLWN